MKDPIERQDVINEIEERKNANEYCNVAVISELNRLEGHIMRLPSAWSEIIRCKDCCFCTSEYNDVGNQCYSCTARFDESGFWDEVEAEDFCSFAERRS